MASLQLRTLFSAIALTSLAGAIQPAWAALPISQQPLVLPSQIKPAFIMSLDNSGSIGSDETLCTTLQGECAFFPSNSGSNNKQGTFFDAAGNMFSSGAASTHNFLRAMRGSNDAKTTTDVNTGSEAPRADIYGAIRDPEFNRAYFNPATVYTPWVNFDASPYLGTCPGAGCATTSSSGVAITSSIANYIHQASGASPIFAPGDSVRTAAPEDPRHPATPTDNGGAGVTIDFTTAVPVSYQYHPGDTIPKGSRFIWRSTASTTTGGLSCNGLKALYPSTDGTIVTMTADYVVMGAPCVGFVTTMYYPGTVYLSTNTAAGADAVPGFNYANVITVPGAGPLGANLYKYEIIPANFANVVDYNAAIQNFANYWTYYADRARAIVAAATQSFEGVDFMRVGKFDISPICSGFGNCNPLTTSAGYTSFISGPDTKYTSQPAGDPLVTMYDLADYTYKTGVVINPIPPGPACTSPGVPAGCVTFSANGGDRFNLYKSILAFDAPNNNTPTRRAVYRLGHQFTRVKNALTSDGVADTSPPILLECQANAGMLFTDGYINDDNAGLPAVGNVDAGLVSNANTTPTSITLFGSAPFTDAQSNTMADITAYFYQQDLVPTLPKGKVPTDAGCPNNKLDCNPNLHMQFYGIPLGAVGKFYDKVVGGISYVDNLNTAADEATTQAFANPPAWAGSGACNSCGGTTDLTPPAVDDIWHAAINSRGKFISAQSPAAVRAGIQTVIASLLAASLPSGSLPVVGVRLGAGSLAYTPSFAKAGNDWTGDIVANTILSDGTAGPQVWDAAAQIKALSNINRDGRKIVIDTSPGSAAGHVSQYFDQSNVSAFGATESAQLTFFGINPATFHAIYGAGLTTNDVVNYLKGDDSNEVGQPSGVFRTRSTVLGDIINSQPAISSANDDFGFQGLTSTDGGGAAGAYATFLASKASRVPSVVAYVGANDGMLHAFNGTATGGQELFGFIPNSVAGTLGALINPNYVHDFYVDGGLTVFDACTSGPAGCSVATNWKTVLAGTPGAGGSGVFALDVSSPSAFPQTGSKVMWDLTGASSADIGINVGTPQVILGEDDIWYVAFGNGFNSTNSNPALVLVNLGTGAITKVLTGNDGGTFDNGIGQIIAADLTGDLVTGGPDGKVDTIYGGDYRGNVWKFDLSSTSSAGWIVAYGNVPLFVAKDKLGNVQPITGGFEISDGPVGGVMLYFGTGSFFLTTDNNVGTPPLVQTLYAIWDNGFAETTGRGTGLTGANALVAQTITANNATSPATRSTSSNTVSYTSAPLSTDRGFFMDLQVGTTTPVADGEKFFGNPIIQNGIVFYTTFEPSGDQCNPGGQRWEYGLDALSGVNALSQINFGNASGCPSGNCGAISLGNGAPIRSVSILVPPSVPANPNQTCTPGVGSCPIPSKYICDVNGNNCVLRPILTDQDLYTACTIIVKTQSSTPPGVLPRPCGRQSWRQVR